MELIGSGAQADIYKGNSNAIKVYKHNIPKSEVEYEYKLQKMAYDYGIPVPQVFDIIEIDNKYGIVMEYVEGIPLGDIILGENNQNEKLFIKSIEIQNDIHKIVTDKYPSMKDKLKGFIIAAGEITNTEKDVLLDKLENAVFENKLCHGDFHVFNLIQTSNDIKVIDWVCASSGSPYADICRTYLLYKIYKEEIANVYLEIYCNMYNIDKSKILFWAPILAGARLGEYTKDEKEKNILKDIIKNESSY